MKAIVVDVGGTNLRVALFDDGQLKDVQRCKVYSAANSDEKGESLYQLFMSQLKDSLNAYLTTYPDTPLAIAFPGPVRPNGTVQSAPTLWGNEVFDVPFREDCERLFQRRIILMNDISAAVWRYAKTIKEDFCLFTLSSGVGNKVFCNGSILLNEEGQGGELGHCQVAFDEYALPCDCGGYGHLGALASGRGIEQLSKFQAAKDPTGFSNSILSQLCDGSADNITTYNFAAALRDKDQFCINVLTRSQHYLATAMSHLYHAIGIKRFVFIGGLSCAIGESYVELLNSVLLQHQWFGLSAEAVVQMCQMGELDDDHSLLGLGYFIQEHANNE